MLYDFDKVDKLKQGSRKELLDFLFINREYISLFYKTLSDAETKSILSNRITDFSFFEFSSNSQQEIFLDMVIKYHNPLEFNFYTTVSTNVYPDRHSIIPRLQIAMLLKEAPQFEHYIFHDVKELPPDVLDYLTIKKLAT